MLPSLSSPLSSHPCPPRRRHHVNAGWWWWCHCHRPPCCRLPCLPIPVPLVIVVVLTQGGGGVAIVVPLVISLVPVPLIIVVVLTQGGGVDEREGLMPSKERLQWVRVSRDEGDGTVPS